MNESLKNLVEKNQRQHDLLVKQLNQINKLKAENAKLLKLLLLTDDSVSNIEMSDTQVRQFREYSRWIQEHYCEKGGEE